MLPTPILVTQGPPLPLVPSVTSIHVNHSVFQANELVAIGTYYFRDA